MTDSDWPSDWPDPDKIKRGEKGEKPAWETDPGDWPKGKKGRGGKGGEREQRPSKEKVPPTWGRDFFDEYGGKGEKHKGGPGGQPAPVDKQALKQECDDAKWAAKQQRQIVKANERRANDARKAAAWQERADREIANVNANQNYQPQGGASASYGKAKRGDGGGCGCIFASVPLWFILLLLTLLALDIWISG